jgi:hypothetical protein
MTQEVTVSLLIKLGSIIVHEDERRTPGYHAFDDSALQTLRNDPEVMEFMAEMDKGAFLPVRRDGVRYLSVEKP